MPKYPGVQQRGETWSASVSRGSGANRVQWRKGGFATAKEAADARADVLDSMVEGTYVPPSDLTVGRYLEEWLDGLAVAGLRATTIVSYRGLAKRWLIPHLGKIPLQELNAHAIDTLYATMTHHYYVRWKVDGKKKRQGPFCREDADRHAKKVTGDRVTDLAVEPASVKLRTVRFAHSVLRKALADAVRKGLRRTNPADDASPPKVSATRAPEKAVWTPEQLRAFLDAERDNYYFGLWHLAAFTGMRRGELCGLRWDAVDLDGASLWVHRTYTTVDHVPAWGDVKTGRSRRRIALDPVTVAVLRRHLKAQKEQQLLLGEGWKGSGCVFTGADGSPLHPDTVGQAFERKAGAKGDRPRLTLHGLRHSHCTHLLAAGVDVRTVSERMGHASTAFTLDHYGHVMPGSQEAAAAAVAALVGA